MPNDKLTILLHRFAVTARAHHEALEAMDEERANAHAGMISGLHRSIIGEGETGREALLALTDDSDPVVAGMAAVYSIRYSSGRCLAVLNRVALEPGLLGFRAGVAVERWESGEWQGPEED
ncbi:MAG: hypothetical protein A2079_01715 [Geobacteraceae bacterium GWC2_48_7]|nr:MAG: hypothetical protein A2079_01715 [Geobacteraceae bacterium GWC2_48_7]